MSVRSILEKASEVAVALLMFFALFFAVGFIYGVEKTRNNRIADIINYIKVDSVDNVPSSLSIACASSRPSYVYDINTMSLEPDPAAKEEALSSFKPLISEAIPSDTGPLMTAGSGLFGFGAAWEAFKMGRGNVREGLIIAFGSVFGAPMGYYVSTNWMNMNCPSEGLFQMLDKRETWTAIVDKLFLKYYNNIYRYCLKVIDGRPASEAQYNAFLDKMRNTGFDKEGRHYTYADFRELKMILERCQR